jgi:PTS system nitrogen regulatory IIA component
MSSFQRGVFEMRLADVMGEDCIMTDLKARSKNDLLEEMAACVGPGLGLDAGRVLDALLDRERLGSTGIGHGVAIPHGRIKGLNGIRVFFGRSRRGVDFNSIDGAPVNLVFMIVAPENSAAAHLKLLAAISHLLKNQEFRSNLLGAGNAPEIYRLIVDADRKTPGL